METTFPSRTVVNPLIRDKATFLATAAETGNKFTHIQVELAPLGGNDLHYHLTFDEKFTAVSGTLGIQKGKNVSYLNEGESAVAKAGELHRFFNPSDAESIVFNVLLEPGSAGFERVVQVAYGLAADGRTTASGIPKNLYHMALIVQWGDTNIPGLFTYIEPLLRWMAKRAERNGIAQELINRYCRF